MQFIQCIGEINILYYLLKMIENLIELNCTAVQPRFELWQYNAASKLNNKKGHLRQGLQA